MIAHTMTVARQRRKTSWTRALLAAVAMAAPTMPSPIGATTEYVVVDRHTGLAIGGYDPVAYFTDRVATPGREPFEHRFAGAIWSFRNAGNRAAFAADPDIYMPRFGGYDPVGVARGVGVAGDPRLWLILGERLYLFYTAEARAAFEADAEPIIAAAEKNWPSVQLTLSP
jgi:hypothetical protein